MKIGKLSRRQAGLIAAMVFSFLFIAFVKLPLDFDDVFVRDVKDFGADPIRKLTLRAEGETRHERLGLSRIITGPYRFRVCTSNTIQQKLTLKTASLAQVVAEKFIPVEAEFDLDPKWIRANPSPVPDEYTTCANDLLVLDVEIDSDDFYCVDLTFVTREVDLTNDIRDVETVERSCFRFDHDISHFKVTPWELFIGWFVYSA